MRTIIITGVSRGLGRSLAKTLADDDTHLVGFGRNLGEFTGSFHSCDVSKPQLAASIFESALAAEPIEDSESVTFISNAGRLGLLAKAPDLDAFEIEHTLSANLTGSAIAVSAFLRRVRGLAIPKTFVQISSGAALSDRAKPSWSLYCASKAGQEQLIRAVALEQQNEEHPATLINVNPGVMETDMQEKIRNASPEVFPDVERFRKMKEEGSIPSPDTVAKKIADLIARPTQLENGKTYNIADY